MRSVISLITAAAFMLHFTLGCCAHHAHAAEGTVGCDHAKAAVHDHDCHGHDGHDHGSPELGDQSPYGSNPECPGRHCNDGHCVFMATGKTVVAKAAFTAPIPLSIAEPAYFGAISSRTAAAIDSGGLFALPVRTHLFHQVLLI